MKTADLIEKIAHLDSKTGERIRFWLEKNFDAETKKEIARLIEQDQKALVDAFYSNLSFGTGGLRGIMGVGSNRMNRYTVAWATQGLANYLRKVYGKNAELRVAIGYDSRNNSKEFAETAARVLAGNRIDVYLFKEMRPTPLVSFACRMHGCHSGIMVTASHNPPAYNGYKVYWNDGAQVLSPHDQGIIDEVNRLHDPDEVTFAPLDSPHIHTMGEEVDARYLKALQSLQLSKGEGKVPLQILYSSLHGTGITLVPDALKRFGFSHLRFVEKQIIPDGNFSTVKKPNPEEKEALQLGIDQMLKEKEDIFIATDPDADRVGVVVRHHDTAVILNGNQIAALLVAFVCKIMKLPKNAAFIKTIVTTDLFKAIVEAHGARSFDVLTGFKYIAEKIRQWEGEYCYIFGGEESYGYLLGTFVRDKDAISSACLIAEAALFAKQQGKTLVDLLNDLYNEYGMYDEQLISLEFEESKEGKEMMAAIMNKARQNPPKALLGDKIATITDLLEKSDLPRADVLIWQLESGTKVIIRPSGTEPKIKVYLLLHEKGARSLDAMKAKGELLAATIKTDTLSLQK